MALALVFAGCGGAGTTDEEPRTEPSAAGATASRATDAPTSAVKLATGPWVQSKAARVRAPEGWESRRLFGESSVTAWLPATGDTICLERVDNHAGDTDLTQLTRQRHRGPLLDGGDVLANRVLVDREAYQIEKTEAGLRVIELGTFAGSSVGAIAFEFRSRSRARHAEVMESVLATLEWKQPPSP